jgi:ribosome maturation factor RimP
MIQKLEQVAQGCCEREGCVLYDLEWVSGSKGQGRVLRVFVDRLDQAVSLEDCEKVSRGLNLMLDVEDVIPGGEYTLEVSTPGLERVLRKPEHFKQALNREIQLRTKQSIYDFNPQLASETKRLNARGEVLATDNEGLVLRVDGAEMRVPYAIVDKANIIFSPQKGQKKSHN